MTAHKLTKLYQILDGDFSVWKTFRSQKECEDYLSDYDVSDYMGELTLTILPMWTNQSEQSISQLMSD
jgi:hypothetical protein